MTTSDSAAQAGVSGADDGLGGTNGDVGAAESGQKGGTWRFLREVGIVLVCALILSVLVRTFLIQAFYVPSQSMENTLMPNDRILASKVTTFISGVGRGEVVVFRDPGGWLPNPGPDTSSPLHKALEFIGLLPSSSGDDLVKRVIGLAGDRVQCCNEAGQIVVNGVGLDEAAYIKPGSRTDQVPFDIVVAPDSVFVLGDNRSQSRDSRFNMDNNKGGIPVGDVVGRVILKVWPLDQWGTVPVPEIFKNPALDNQSGGTPLPNPGDGSGKQ